MYLLITADIKAVCDYMSSHSCTLHNLKPAGILILRSFSVQLMNNRDGQF